MYFIQITISFLFSSPIAFFMQNLRIMLRHVFSSTLFTLVTYLLSVKYIIINSINFYIIPWYCISILYLSQA